MHGRGDEGRLEAAHVPSFLSLTYSPLKLETGRELEQETWNREGRERT